MRLILTAAAALLLSACSDAPDGGDVPPEADAATPAPAPTETVTADPHSFANVTAVTTTHLVLDLDVDFEARQLRGSAVHTLDRSEGASQFVVDSRDLTIDAVTDAATGEALAWTIGDAVEYLGAPLTIGLEGETETVRIDYATAPGASGLQWLEPGQTAGGEHPFLFSQAQAQHARSFIPLQDTPHVRVTFTATLRTPPELVAVMGAEMAPVETPGVYRFEMPQAIPSYLIAVAVGDLAFQPMGERTGVYAEPSVLEAAAWEFAETEAMMAVSEELFGPYRWGRYDLLILPPSFPFGGMENPRLSFITPTVIAGDRSLTALIAHELAHSWSGNLVTNAVWSDLWLNEGFTVYLEALIMEAVYGEDRRRMEDVLGYRSLLEEFETLPPGDQLLAANLAGRDPDDAFSNVAYEKGRLFIIWLESRIGREPMAFFLREYFEQFAFQSITTPRFETYALEKLGEAGLTQDDLDRWLREPGLPEDAVLPTSDAFERIDAVAAEWLAGDRAPEAVPFGEWSVHEQLYFLSLVPESIEVEALAALDAAHGLTGAANAEVAHRWYRIAIAQRYEPAFAALTAYLEEIGRIKLVRPLYEALFVSDWGAPMASEIYARARAGYHPLTQSTIDALVP